MLRPLVQRFFRIWRSYQATYILLHCLILMCCGCLFTGSMDSSLRAVWDVHPAFVTRRLCHLCQHYYLQQRQQSQGEPCRCWLPALPCPLSFSVMTCYCWGIMLQRQQFWVIHAGVNGPLCLSFSLSLLRLVVAAGICCIDSRFRLSMQVLMAHFAFPSLCLCYDLLPWLPAVEAAVLR